MEAPDLLEHWKENMPIFQTSPRPADPSHRIGTEFADRNPTLGPYNWWSWDPRKGALVSPKVSAEPLGQLVGGAIAAALPGLPDARVFVRPQPPSPWAPNP